MDYSAMSYGELFHRYSVSMDPWECRMLLVELETRAEWSTGGRDEYEEGDYSSPEHKVLDDDLPF